VQRQLPFTVSHLKLCTEVISLFFCRAIFEVQNALFVLQTSWWSAEVGRGLCTTLRSPGGDPYSSSALLVPVPQCNSQHQSQVQLSSPKHEIETKPHMVPNKYKACRDYAH
jgi:hypothetical protein